MLAIIASRSCHKYFIEILFETRNIMILLQQDDVFSSARILYHKTGYKNKNFDYLA